MTIHEEAVGLGAHPVTCADCDPIREFVERVYARALILRQYSCGSHDIYTSVTIALGQEFDKHVLERRWRFQRREEDGVGSVKN